ncbi:MAG: ComF family protein [Rhizobacter sp.]|nr:ComF family protein [Chlorobiales bacterium]
MPILSPHLLRNLLHLVYPNVCIACKSLLADDEDHLCRLCVGDFDRFMLPGESADAMMASLNEHFPSQTEVDDAVSLYRFHKDGLLQHAIHAFKYDGLPSVAVQLGEQLGKHLSAERPDARLDGIVPLPLHKLKFIERGYNQAEKLAQGVSRILGVPVLVDTAKRTRYTSSQTGFDLSGREKNISGAFHCPKPLTNQRLVLVDDVFTTGATLRVCAAALKAAGASHITIASLAVAGN